MIGDGENVLSVCVVFMFVNICFEVVCECEELIEEEKEVR